MSEPLLEFELDGMVDGVADIWSGSANASGILGVRAEQRVQRDCGLAQAGFSICDDSIERIRNLSVQSRSAKAPVARIQAVLIFHTASEIQMCSLAPGVIYLGN